jgi:hypothetical protein
MSDVSVPVLIPYARFLEYRARRLVIVTALEQPDGRIIIPDTAKEKPRQAPSPLATASESASMSKPAIGSLSASTPAIKIDRHE